MVESVNGELLVSVSEQLHLTWSTDTHMALLTLAQEVMAVLRCVRPTKGEWHGVWGKGRGERWKGREGKEGKGVLE